MQAIELPSQKNINDYLTNLVGSYNAKIRQYYTVEKTDFKEIEPYFLLFLDSDHSFIVYCVKASIGSNDTVNFIFKKILSSENISIVRDFNHELSFYFPGIMLGGSRGILTNYSFESQDTILHANFILSVTSDEISNNTYPNSKDFAEQLVLDEKHDIEVDKINEVWIPFYQKNFDIIFNDDNLLNLSNKIIFNISWNKSYNYETFESHFRELNESIKNEKKFIWEDISQNEIWFSLLFFILYIIIFSFYIIMYNYGKIKLFELPTVLIGALFAIMWGYAIFNTPKSYIIIQIISPIIAVIFPLIIWYILKKKGKIFVEKMKRKKRIKKAIQQVKNGEEPMELTVEDSDYFRDDYGKKEIQKIKGKEILKKHLQMKMEELAQKAKEAIDKEKELEIERAKNINKLFDQYKQKKKNHKKK